MPDPQPRVFAKSSATNTIIFTFLTLCLASCTAAPQSANNPHTTTNINDPIRSAPGPKISPQNTAPITTQIGTSVQGKPIHATVYGDTQAPKQTTLIIASIHGDEPAGTPLLRAFGAALIAQQARLEAYGTRVVLIPIVNPDGYENNRRHNSRGVDLNRNFPAGNRVNSRRNGLTALSEPEARAIFGVIEEYGPEQIVSIHQMGRPGGIDYDGPASELAEGMAEVGELRIRRLGAKPGSLGSYVSMVLGLPIITLELPRGAEGLTDVEIYERYGRMLWAAVGLGN